MKLIGADGQVHGALLALRGREGNADPSALEIAEHFYKRGVRDCLRASAKLADVAPTMRQFLDLLEGDNDEDKAERPS